MGEPNSEFDAWIGREQNDQTDVVTTRLHNCFNATFGDALSTAEKVAPGLHWCLSPPTVVASKLSCDGHPAKGGFLPPIVLPRRMWASGEVRFLSPLNVGDIVTKHSRIKDVKWKSGSSGQLCFVEIEHTHRTSDRVAIEETQTVVFRSASTGPGASCPSAPPPEPSFDHHETVKIDSVFLFRYSALTFNAHRIHYDLPYATDQEYYPGLVIHGPLQATLLLNFASKLKNACPRSFSFRGTAPATGAQALRLGADESDNGFSMAVVTENGATSMKAKATWCS